jgi:hypothetical protein
MSPTTKLLLGVIAVAVVLGLVGVPLWVIVLLVVGVPVAGYLMLDPTQRQRLRRSGRKQIGR